MPTKRQIEGARKRLRAVEKAPRRKRATEKISGKRENSDEVARFFDESRAEFSAVMDEAFQLC